MMPGLASSFEGAGVSVFPARTAEHPGIRSWFVYEAEPGTTIKDKVEIINSTNKTVTMNVAVLDGAVTSDGGYTFVSGVSDNKDLGSWAKLEKTEVVLAPKARTFLDLTVTVPENADVGSHPGGVVVWEKEAKSVADSKGGQLKIITRVGARMYLTVPGDIIRKLEVKDLNHSYQQGVLYFGMTLINKGNVQLTPEVDITLKGLFGSLGTQSRSQVGLILRGTSIRARIPWQSKPPFFGRYTADFRIHYGDKDFKGEYVKDEYIDVRYVFWVIPWILLLWILLIIFILFFLRNLWKWLIIQKRLNEKTKKHKVKQGETLTIIAGLYDVPPKKIAKFNLLKWPYDLHEGDILLIPQGKMTKEEKAQVDEELKLQKEKDLEPVIFEKGDKLKDVADFAGISVKEAILINRLRWPYRLRVGQELLVPRLKREQAVKKTSKQSRKPRKKK
ncbi:LysM peptidoglycan-binding domain-containing protein [Patescibacteria group bacterium]|nr:LysM peptidoglycan-binding domain-containing protein [Patescibacteria group bacterium]